ncbi:MAG: gamma-glutamyltransferase [Actinomycetota bacterium]|nr:gamma-glutamyltransferase [Actinomycetota bacterium]
MIRSQMVQTRTEVLAERGVVSAGHMREAQAGTRMLEEGGNAIDALVAAAFTAFVIEPAQSGLGGYGHLAMFLAEPGEFVTVDHYVRAPRAARPEMFDPDPAQPTMYYGWPRVAGQRNEWGHLAAGIPGAVAGLCVAQERYGKVRLAQVLEPAIEAAEEGVPVTWNLVLAIAARFEEIRSLPEAAALLLRDGKPPRLPSLDREGDRLDLSELATTLRRIAREGAAGFYTGPVAEAIEREFRAHGGFLTADDLATYEPKILRESPATYRAFSYVTANDTIGYEALNILDHFDLPRYGPESVEFRHLAAEALGHAFADNMTHYGDPDVTPSPVHGLVSRGFATERAAGIDLERAAPRPIVAGDPWAYETAGAPSGGLAAAPSCGGTHGTTQIATADRDGNMAALITSLSNAFGSLVVVPGTGVILNDGMQNFDPRPGRANSIAPGKMPIFAVPAIVATRDGKAAFAAAGAGGYRITAGVIHTMLHALDFALGLQAAVDAPRVHCQGDETFVDSRISADVRERLAEMGHHVVVQEEVPGSFYFGRVSAVARDAKTGMLHAASGPAWHTAAAGA